MTSTRPEPTASATVSVSGGPGAEGGPGGGRVLALASAVTFLAFLDATVVNVAFPDLRRAFPEVSLPRLTWVVSAYAVLFAALLAAAGRLADTLGRRSLFLGSTLAFTLTSLAASAAPTADLLIVARALQGAAAAGMIPAALGLVLAHTPPARRAAALGAWSAAGGLAAAVGPSIGGLLVEWWDWRAIFLINVPLGLAVGWAAARVIPREPRTGRRLPDPVGTTALALGIAGVVAGLSQGTEWGWTDPKVLALVIGGALAGILALRRSRSHPAPAVDRDLWREPLFARANIGALLFGAAMYAWLLTGPSYLIERWNYSVLQAGFGVTPGAVLAMAGALVVGRRVPARLQGAAVTVGSLLFAANALLLWGWVGESSSYAQIFLPAGLLGGLGIGIVVTALSTTASAGLPPQRFAAGTGLLMTARQLGGALGVAGTAALLTGAGTGDHWRGVFLLIAFSALGAAVAGASMRLSGPAKPTAPARPGG
ncbi:DHA2 family efflux MFS transporter permease subunit [Streptomyces sp. NBC_01298]|uniref:DHA2 family efflux MFS transporter permease subunit n=1 Tax=Streptomyces sp. NBC_01298 TaxID=2903817 RepID=UPI002E1206BD|nr:DHA2 family efflux MFS transporter permease subunit [Streptomyces sp. NBC_01298]